MKTNFSFSHPSSDCKQASCLLSCDENNKQRVYSSALIIWWHFNSFVLVRLQLSRLSETLFYCHRKFPPFRVVSILQVRRASLQQQTGKISATLFCCCVPRCNENSKSYFRCVWGGKQEGKMGKTQVEEFDRMRPRREKSRWKALTLCGWMKIKVNASRRVRKRKLAARLKLTLGSKFARCFCKIMLLAILCDSSSSFWSSETASKLFKVRQSEVFNVCRKFRRCVFFWKSEFHEF